MAVRLSSILLSLLLVLLSACGSQQTSPTEPAAANPTSPAATTPAGEQPTTASEQPTTASEQPGGTVDQGACTPESASKEAPSGNVNLVIATGGTGGVYYPYGGGLADIISKNLPNSQATAEVTAASVDNMKLILAEEVDLAFTLADTAFDAFSGRATFEEIGAVPVCSLAVLYTNYLHIVATEDSGVSSVADLSGKRVSVGSAGSGTEVIANRVLAAAGLDPQQDITRDNLSVAESVAALKDGKIDAFFWSGGVPTGAVTELMATPNMAVRFIPSAELVEPLSQEWGPLYSEAVIPGGGYAGVDQDVPVIGVANLLTVNASMSEQQAYDILKTIFDNLSDVHQIHPEAQKLSPESAVQGSSIPFHPGAIKFYQEQGAWPAE